LTGFNEIICFASQFLPCESLENLLLKLKNIKIKIVRLSEKIKRQNQERTSVQRFLTDNQIELGANKNEKKNL